MILKTFPLRTILTVTTGRLLTDPEKDNDNGIGRLYKILEHITGEASYTHTLGRFAEEAKPYLLELIPELYKANSLEKLDEWVESTKDGSDEGIKMWIRSLLMTTDLKEEYEIGQIIGHVSKNPIEEFCLMIGPKFLVLNGINPGKEIQNQYKPSTVF